MNDFIGEDDDDLIAKCVKDVDIAAALDALYVGGKFTADVWHEINEQVLTMAKMRIRAESEKP